MSFDRFKMFAGFYRAFSSEAYKDTMRAVEHLASSNLLLLERKPEEERREILAKAQSLTEKLSDAVANEAPMVASLALLTAVRVYERFIQEQADRYRK